MMALHHLCPVLQLMLVCMLQMRNFSDDDLSIIGCSTSVYYCPFTVDALPRD